LLFLLKSFRVPFFLTVWVILGGVYLPVVAAQPSIAVLELDAKGGVKPDEASIITDRLRAQLLQTGHFQVLERSKMESLLKELGFQQSLYCDDSKCTAQIGKLLGVDGLVTGSVSRLDTIYTLSIRVLNVEKGYIIREEFQDCECPLKDVLTKVTPQLVARLLNQRTVTSLPQSQSSQQTASNTLPPQAALEVRTIAGKGGWAGFKEGPALEANFSLPSSLLFDSQGQLLIADAQNHRIRKLSLNEQVSTLSGSDHGLIGGSSFADGKGEYAKFNFPSAMAHHPSGNIYIADADNNRIRIMTPNGEVSTFVGTGVAGFSNGNPAVAQFHRPRGIVIDAQGNLYVADTGNHSIRKVAPNGIVSTLAGNGNSGFANGQGANAQFNAPTTLIMGPAGDLYLADTFNHSIRKITLSGEVTTIAGNGWGGFRDGPSAQAQFRSPRGLAFDAQNNLYIADTENNRIRKYNPNNQQVVTVAGNGNANFADGNAAVAQFNQPTGLLFDQTGHLLIADSGNNRIRELIFY
jgi:hypothetical protein